MRSPQSEWDVVRERLRAGQSFEEIEEYISSTELPADEKSALWLWAWAELPFEQRSGILPLTTPRKKIRDWLLRKS